MVARGDLGVELDPEDVPLIQKQIIRKCKSVGKLVITATQMLESMIYNPVPTRAEASDVANAVWDGTDVVMLSGESSVGKYPVEAVRTMNNILLKTESSPDFNLNIHYETPRHFSDNLFDSTGRAIADISEQINASLIVAFTHFGRKAKVISKYRPKARIVAISDNFDTLNRLNIYHGIIPYFLEKFETEDSAIEKANEILKQNNLITNGDVVIYTAGSPHTEKSRSNWMRFAEI
jgi:pyruvate kinase